MSRGTSTLTLDSGFGGVNQNPRIHTNVQLDIVANSGASDVLVTAANLLCSGDIIAYYSDERLKTGLKPITSALDKVNSLRAVTYYQNELADDLMSVKQPERQVGIIAQDIQKVLPEVVKIAPFDATTDKDGNKISKSGENYLTVQYEKIVPLLVAAIQELNDKVVNLEEQLKNK